MSPRICLLLASLLAVCLAPPVSGRRLLDGSDRNNSTTTPSPSDPMMPSNSSLQFVASYNGDGTAYSDAVANTGSGFACSFRYLNDKFSKFFAAINSAQWDEGRACGRCIVARCIDPMCTTNQPVKVQIVDLCPECKEGDVDFSFGAYRDLTGLWPHRLHIEWGWTDCGEDISGDIRFDPKDGSNDFWRAFYLSNSRYPITSVKLGETELQRSQFNFWIHSGGLPTDATMEMTAESGETVKVAFPGMGGTSDLGVQFSIN